MMQKKLEQNCEVCTKVLREMPQTYFICDHLGSIISNSDRLKDTIKMPKDNELPNNVDEFSEELSRIISKSWENIPATIKGGNWQEVYFKANNAQPIIIEVNIQKIILSDTEYLMVCLWDNNAKKRADQKENTSKKIEALGTLSGGIAHEYNNMLMVIGGYIQKTIRELDENNPIKGRLEKANAAAQRATSLSKQLLIFSGKHAREHKICNLSKSLQGLKENIEELLPSNVVLDLDIGDDIAKSNLDPKQFEEAILNLVQNGIEAMPMGGNLKIHQYSVAVEANTMLNVVVKIPPGNFVCIEISDTGVGIDSAISDSIFDPFFSTKQDSSAGLGLAVVFGFVKASEGYINLLSTLDEGTTIQLFFPKTIAEISVIDKENKNIPMGNGETILIVDDEEDVLSIVSDNLETLGYNVITASDGIEGLEMEEEYAGKIDLVISDVVMPGYSGPEMIRAMVSQNPELNYFFMSGFAPQKDNSRTKLPEGAILLAKPVELETLAQHCRAALDSSSNKINLNFKGAANER